MKVSYSYASGRVSSHCITWTQEKKRHRKYFRSRIEALKFRNDKEQELGIRDRQAIENEVIFWVLSEIKDKLDLMEGRLEQLEKSFCATRIGASRHAKTSCPQSLTNLGSGESSTDFFSKAVLPFR